MVAALHSAKSQVVALEAMLHLLNDQFSGGMEATQTQLAEEGACTGAACFLTTNGAIIARPTDLPADQRRFHIFYYYHTEFAISSLRSCVSLVTLCV